jgi:hypothetical protein
VEIGYIKILISISLAIEGWVLGHYLSSQREVRSKKRELVTQYLIESFESLIKFSAVQVGNEPDSTIVAEDFNNAVTKIQLLGSACQIELTV